ASQACLRFYYKNGTGGTTGSRPKISIDNIGVTSTSGSSSAPTVTTTAASNVGSTTATTGGNVTSDGGAAVSARGVAYATTSDPTTANSTTSDGTGTGSFVSSITGLNSSTLYNVRAYATNSVGTSYGSNETFTTTAPSPEIVVTSSSFTSDFGTVLTGANSATSSYSVSGSNLTADITITPPTGFQIRTGSNAFSSSAVVLSPSSGTVASTTIYVRFSPTTEGAFSANITHTSTGATTQNLAVSGRNPISYIWNQTGTASAATSSNWTPARTTTHATDRLIINNGAANTLTGWSTASIRSLMVSNSSTVTLLGSADATISISDSLLVGASSSLILDGSSSSVDLVVTMGASSSKAEIAGTMAFYGGGAHRLVSTLANGIEFLNGATFVAQSFSGNPFGTTTAGSVVFRNGSTYVFRGGSNPFVLTQPSSVVSFEINSEFIVKTTISPSLSGRTYGNLTFDTSTISNAYTGSNKITINSLSVNSGNVNLNLTGGIDISGSITSNGTLTFTPASASTVTLNGTNQTLSGTGSLSFGSNATFSCANSGSASVNPGLGFNVNGPLTVSDGSTLSIGGTLNLDGTGAVTNNGTIAYGAAGALVYGS
ncbi:MAG: beta strand repeat-containing protein, partial [Bacteroidia bacterium]